MPSPNLHRTSDADYRQADAEMDHDRLGQSGVRKHCLREGLPGMRQASRDPSSFEPRSNRSSATRWSRGLPPGGALERSDAALSRRPEPGDLVQPAAMRTVEPAPPASGDRRK